MSSNACLIAHACAYNKVAIYGDVYVRYAWYLSIVNDLITMLWEFPLFYPLCASIYITKNDVTKCREAIINRIARRRKDSTCSFVCILCMRSLFPLCLRTCTRTPHTYEHTYSYQYVHPVYTVWTLAHFFCIHTCVLSLTRMRLHIHV